MRVRKLLPDFDRAKTRRLIRVSNRRARTKSESGRFTLQKGSSTAISSLSLLLPLPKTLLFRHLHILAQMSDHATIDKTEKVLETMPAQLANPVPPVASSGDSTVAPTFVDAEKHDSKHSGNGNDVEAAEKSAEAAAAGATEDTSRLLTGKKLALVFSGMLLSVFLSELVKVPGRSRPMTSVEARQ